MGCHYKIGKGEAPALEILKKRLNGRKGSGG
jgi:hypothetical protein